MKAIKKIKWLLVVIVLLVIVVVVAVVLYADKVTKYSVETAGTYALGVETRLGSANLSLLSGSVALRDLEVDNPAEFETDKILDCGLCSTQVEVGSLISDTVQVRTIKLEDVKVTFEQKGLQSNFNVILKNIEKLQKKDATKTETKAKKGPGKNVRVDKIEIINASADLKLAPIPGKVDVIPVKLAPIVIENLSTGDNQAVMLATVIQKVFMALAKGILESGVDLPDQLGKALAGSLGSLEDSLGQITTQTDKVLKEGTKAIEEGGKALEEAGKGLEGLLKAPGDILKPKKEEGSKE